jgi:hypothetical protein
MSSLRRPSFSAFGLLTLASSIAACGSSPPVAPAAPTAPAQTTPKEQTFDTSAVPEPAGLVLLGRVNKPNAILSTAGNWAHFPLPAGADLVRSLTDDAVADVVDLSQPVDFALTVELSAKGFRPDVKGLAAFSVAVKDYEDAKAKLSAKHELQVRPNGQLKMVIGLPSKHHRRRHDRTEESSRGDDAEEGDGCILAPAPVGARLVCGEDADLNALAPYLSRTMPRRSWTSDIHLEVHPEPVRGPLKDLRGLKNFAAGVGGGGIFEAVIDELTDIVDDVQKVDVDAEVADRGITLATRLEFQSKKSLLAQSASAPGGEPAPASFWHLPADTDSAFFARASDPKLFDHPRELLGNALVDLASKSGMPQAEQTALKDLLAQRLFKLWSDGPGIYAKGFDQAAIEKASSSLKSIKPENRGAREEAKRVLHEQALGWHLLQVSQPIAQVGPTLKDLAALWNRPTFAKWAATTAGNGSELPRIRVTPLTGVAALPKDTVHVEISVPRDPVVDDSPAKGGKPKKVTLKPYVVHVLAVPDGAKTWLGIGLDAKLVAQKAAASLATAPDDNTLGKVSGMEPLREGQLSTGGYLTLRGLLAFSAIESSERSPFKQLASLPHKGETPIFVTSHSEPPSAEMKAGGSVATVRVSRAEIEDIIHLAMSLH